MEALLSKKQEDMVEQKEDMMEVDDQQTSSMLKSTEEMQEVERRSQCGRVDGQRCENVVKWMEDISKRKEEMHEGNRKAKETIKEVERMLDDIKRSEDNTSKRLAKIQVGMFRRLEELQSHIRNHMECWTTGRIIYDPLKIFQTNEVQADVDDVLSVTKLKKGKRDKEIQKMEEDKHDLKEQNLES